MGVPQEGQKWVSGGTEVPHLVQKLATMLSLLVVLNWTGRTELDWSY
jgi:hypothetical protein